MNLRIAEITEASAEKQVWEKFVRSCHHKTFLQSWNWGEFNRFLGNKIFRLGIFNNEILLGVCLVMKIQARRGSFLFCPHGPLIQDRSEASLFDAGSATDVVSLKTSNEKIEDRARAEIYKFFLDYLKNFGKQEKISFIRVSPFLLDTPCNQKIFASCGFREAPIHMMHPELTWELDIQKSLDDILLGMRKTTRYLIRRAPKDGVHVEIRTDKEAVRLFHEIHQDTVNRQHFVPFSLEYFEKEFNAFISDNQIALFFGYYGGKIISASMIVFYGDSAYYHHGASLSEYHKIPASYLVQFEVIQEAKRRGCRVYNFWGISPDNEPNHPWAGLSLFKKGFGGYESQYLHAKDYVLSPKYWLTFAIERVRRMKRGL